MIVTRANRTKQKNIGPIRLVVFGILAFFYPVFVSMYNFFPIFFGLCAYLLILAIKRQNIPMIIICTIYSISLEINFSMPLFNIIISVLIFYVLGYNRVRLWTTCKPCIATVSVISIYFVYFITVFLDDIAFSTTNHSIDFNWFLVFNIFIDIFLAAML
jgi:hypothetical protein